MITAYIYISLQGVCKRRLLDVIKFLMRLLKSQIPTDKYNNITDDSDKFQG